MLDIVWTSRFKKDYKVVVKRRLDLHKLEHVISLLQNEIILPASYKDHKLHGNYVGHRECHIQPDWLLIYRLTAEEVVLARTGSHSDLF